MAIPLQTPPPEQETLRPTEYSEKTSEDRVRYASTLYRQEAINAVTSRYGTPVRPLGLNGSILTAFMLMILLTVAVFLAVGSYTRKETVSGVVQPSDGAARVTTLTTGVISEVLVRDGQPVEAGAPIVRFSADPSITANGGGAVRLSALVAEGAAREAAALAVQTKARVVAGQRALEDLQARRAGLIADQTSLAESAEMQKERVRLTQETLEAGRALNARQLFSDLQLRQREEALIAARQTLSSLERESKRNTASLRQLSAEEGSLAADLAQAEAETQRLVAQLDQRRAEQMASQSMVLVASRAGQIAALQARTGTTAQAGQTLAVILPKGAQLQAELWVPSSAVGFIQVGGYVRLMYDAFPYQKFGVGRGRIASIAGAPTNPNDLPAPIQATEALYRVAVVLDEDSVSGYGRQWRLAPGMRLSADLILDERSLWEWLFDPIIAAQQRVANKRQ